MSSFRCRSGSVESVQNPLADDDVIDSQNVSDVKMLRSGFDINDFVGLEITRDTVEQICSDKETRIKDT